MAYITGMIVKKKDLPVDSKKAETLEIKEDYCIGCGLCVKLLPEYYEMNQNKAVVTKMPEGKEAVLALKESIEKFQSILFFFFFNTVSRSFYLPSGKWKSSTLACVVRSKPGCRSDFRQDLLRVCLPYEYSDDPHRMAVQKAEASNTEYP